MAAAQSNNKRDNEDKPTGFLDLPAEICNNIYHMAVPTGSTIMLRRRPTPISEHVKLKTLDVDWSSPVSRAIIKGIASLARSCRQVHNDLTPILYGSNTFEPYSIQDLDTFLTSIGDSRKLLRHIRVGSHVNDQAALKRIVARLTHAKGLKTFKMQNPRNMTDARCNAPEPAVFAERLRVLIQVRYERSGDAEAAAGAVDLYPRMWSQDAEHVAELQADAKKYTNDVRGEPMRLLEREEMDRTHRAKRSRARQLSARRQGLYSIMGPERGLGEGS